jgi:hypothetical protein
VQVIERRVEEARREIRVVDAALAQEPRHREFHTDRRGQHLRGGLIARIEIPAQRDHRPWQRGIRHVITAPESELSDAE